jgi:hypothetical protein
MENGIMSTAIQKNAISRYSKNGFSPAHCPSVSNGKTNGYLNGIYEAGEYF